MATLVTPTPTPPPSPAYYADEVQQVYISRATLQLKQHFNTYEWHTMVRTSSPVPAAPPTTPITTTATTIRAQTADVLTPEASEVLDQEVVEQCQVMTRPQKPLAVILNHQRHTLAGPRTDAPQTIATIVDNFMDSERYHTLCNSLIRPLDNAIETSHL